MTAIVLLLLLAQGGVEHRFETSKLAQIETPSRSATAAAETDIATQMNEATEARMVLLSARMYFAIKSVEAYRNGVQKRQLSANERNLNNFHIEVIPGGESKWLRQGERDTHFEVMIAPQQVPGARVLLHGPNVLGRLVLYAVRKSDMQVTRSEFQK
jgi:hypothetical protein